METFWRVAQIRISGEIDVTFLQGPYEDSRLDIVDLGFDPYVVVLGAGKTAMDQTGATKTTVN